MIHEDERRRLEDWPEAKVITAKQDCVLGNHFHKEKTEHFILVDGEGDIVVNGNRAKMRKGKMLTVLPNQCHSFYLKKGSVLVGLCSHRYDSNDDFKC